MRWIPVTAVLVARLASAAPTPEALLKACDDGDAGACEDAASLAARERRFDDVDALLARAKALATAADPRDWKVTRRDGAVPTDSPAPEPSLPPLVAAPVAEAPAAVLQPALATEAVPPSAPERAAPRAIDVAFEGSTESPAKETTSVRRRVDQEAVDTSSRWGVAALAGGVGTFRVDGQRGMAASGRFGIGPRFALVERDNLDTQALPSVSALVGLDYSGVARLFGEVRMELLVARPGGLCQPGFTLYALSGVDLPIGARPEGYVGAGLGWNWLPRGDGVRGLASAVASGLGSGGVLLAVAGLLVAPLVVAFIFAGRAEVRYYPTLGLPNGPSVVAVTLGMGF